MSSVVLGSTTVLSETGGVVTVQSGTKFPPGHIIQTFGNYSNVSFSFDTMTIRNLDPILLDSDINPWLIPGVITGFEIIKMNFLVNLPY